MVTIWVIDMAENYHSNRHDPIRVLDATVVGHLDETCRARLDRGLRYALGTVNRDTTRRTHFVFP